MQDARSRCPVCASPFRYVAEDAYLQLEPIPSMFTRSQVERHMSHTTDPDTLRQVSSLASASAVASRLRQLEVVAMRILDLAVEQKDGTLAIRALREARQTLHEMATLTDQLSGALDTSGTAIDLDEAIADHIGHRMRHDDPPTDEEGTHVRHDAGPGQRPELPPRLRALGPGSHEEGEGGHDPQPPT